MKILIVYCHPNEKSHAARLRDAAIGALERRGHGVDLLDLYADGFDPVMGRDEWSAYIRTDPPPGTLAAHVERLRAAEGLIFIYPTWWYGMPALIKGYIDRVWLPNVAFSMGPGGEFIPDRLSKIDRFMVVTSYGSPRWLIRAVLGDPGRRAVLGGLGRLLSPRRKSAWLAIYDMDKVTPRRLAAFERRVLRTLGRLF